ncbi:phosphatidylinositol transfer protein alpha isoform [Biomphalaria glabrata]|uniref:Phosphatidylinositol transfer protein alpha isoform-like n=1 Tax=Biomphalaria glabrata TaxID=6526 RepID=A0A2C9JGS9_BIOGL|nr:phosphatidylinositol transfer protein alpha isoform-like [Biomphalaria glabrata]KAI8753451.1 phosphatidylinositol transfer protein alpha isoform-like [Biomphalaria glabrata]KAI8783259.1 phosphatidylinositol transfer protein alpha isoform [Biomphalaria glabrata]
MQQQAHSIKEFRIVLPMSVEEYNIGQLWSVAQASKNETGGGEGVEVRVNEPFDETTHPPNPKLFANGREYTTGQYTHKIYHLSQKVPAFVRLLAPKGSLEIHEQAWNAYPYCRTVVTNPDYMKENFYIIIESFHAPDNGNTPNIHGLTGRDLSARQVVKLDVANDKVSSKDYKPEWDPCLVGSPKAGRSPLPHDKNGNWMNNVSPVMCCYKLVKVWFKWFGLQKRMENFILSQEQRLFLNFNRQVVCWTDQYHGMTMADIRRLEEQVKEELERQRKEGPLRGMTASEDEK